MSYGLIAAQGPLAPKPGMAQGTTIAGRLVEGRATPSRGRKGHAALGFRPQRGGACDLDGAIIMSIVGTRQSR